MISFSIDSQIGIIIDIQNVYKKKLPVTFMIPIVDSIKVVHLGIRETAQLVAWRPYWKLKK